MVEPPSNRETSTPDAASSSGLPAWFVIVAVTLLGTAVPVALHYRTHGVLNVHQLGMAFFFWLNTIIASWEICLFFRIDGIREQYERYLEHYRGREFDRVLDFFGERIPLRRIFSMDQWAQVWSSYSLFDESYANKKSFGFFIDIGNGFTTLVPSLVFIYGITYEPFSARALGLMGLLISYQMFYGTVVYVTSFVVNERYRGHPLPTVLGFVGISNGLWLVFPLWAMGLAVHMIYTNSYSVFLS